MPREPIAEFTKDGQTKLAYSPIEAVTLKFEGWKQVDADTPAPAAAPPADTAYTPPASDPLDLTQHTDDNPEE